MEILHTVSVGCECTNDFNNAFEEIACINELSGKQSTSHSLMNLTVTSVGLSHKYIAELFLFLADPEEHMGKGFNSHTGQFPTNNFPYGQSRPCTYVNCLVGEAG